MDALVRVAIDFETSHLLFPLLVAIVLGLLGGAIVIRDRAHLAAAAITWCKIFTDMDKRRFFGTMALTLIYFSLMEPVGRFWPNTGMGFLLCSIPFIFLSGYLFMHERRLRHAVPLTLAALIAPTFAWWLFSGPFFLTLP